MIYHPKSFENILETEHLYKSISYIITCDILSQKSGNTFFDKSHFSSENRNLSDININRDSGLVFVNLQISQRGLTNGKKML